MWCIDYHNSTGHAFKGKIICTSTKVLVDFDPQLCTLLSSVCTWWWFSGVDTK